MIININGTPFEIPDATTVLGMVEIRNLPADGVVIELNGEIIKANRWNSVTLSPDDNVEIIRFVGGG